MQMKRKKFWITFSSIVVCIFLICLGTVLFTKLKTVNVEFRTAFGVETTNLEENVIENIKESGEFNYSKSLLFTNFDKNVEKIEKANPYIKVEQVLRKFPNKVHIYVSERVPKYRVQDKNEQTKWYILDVEFKVLETIVGSDAMESSGFKDDTVAIDFISFTAHNGDFIKLSTEKQYMSQILAGVYGRTKDTTIINSVDYNENEKTFYISMKANKDGDYENGCVMQIAGTDNIKDKVFVATCCYCQDDIEHDGSVDMSKKVLIIVEGENGSYIGKMKNQEEQD